MLVDLGRNDLGRVCVSGSVSVSDFCHIERYSHVMHLVTNVQGTLRDDRSPVDLFLSCFPAGTLTGAPKIRAMELIRSEEHTSELQSRQYLVCRLLLEKKKKT